MPDQAIPVRTKVRTIRQMCVDADPEFMTEGLRPVEYEMGKAKRVFRGFYQERGAYTPED